jgi:multicomponent Na+:H+ antiporter subunit D
VIALPLVLGWGSALLLAFLDGRRRGVRLLAVVLGAALVASLAVLSAEVARAGAVSAATGGWPAEVGILLHADALGTLFALSSAALLVAVLAFEVAHGSEHRYLPALMLFVATGLTGLFLTGDVFSFYVFFEVAMVSAFALAGYGGGRREARAAPVFVVVNLLGSALFLGAVAMLYRLTGTLEMSAVAAAAREAAPGALLLVGGLLLVAFGLKLGLFPFHYWLPVVYRQTRPAVAALFAGALANLASYALLRFGAGVLPGVLAAARPALLLLGGASVVYGSVQAVHRRDLRDTLAYSSIGQVGYSVLALAVGGPVGLAAAALYSVVNALHKTALFLGAGTLGRSMGAMVLVTGLSLAGVPPSAGFVGKVALFRSAMAAGEAGLLVVFAAGGALSLVYVLHAWHHTFRGAAAERDGGGTSPVLARGLVVLLVLAVVALGVWPAPLVDWSGRAAAALEAAP